MAHLESLIVLDASPRSRATLTFGFERAGFSVYATDQGSDALAMAQTQAAQLLVISADQMLSDGPTAFTVVQRLRDTPSTRKLPVVVIGESPLRAEAMRSGADEFISRPAFIRDVVTLSKISVTSRQQGDGGVVSGLLDDYGLYFLVRALAVAKRSGVLELTRGRRAGEVHLADGNVVTSKVGELTGPSAFFHLLLWTGATLQLRLHSVHVTRPHVDRSVDDLLSGGARYAQDLEAAAALVGGANAIYRQELRRVNELRPQIPSEVLRLLKFYDGRRTLIDVVQDSPFRPFDTIKVTQRLKDLGAIEQLAVSVNSSPLTAELAVRDWLVGATIDERPATVTEVGRRAAEAIAQAREARKNPAPTPAADILNERLPGVISGTIQARPPSSPQLPVAQAKLEVAAQSLAAETRPAAPEIPEPKTLSGTFNAVERDFFEREAELHTVDPVDNFDDLEAKPRRKTGWLSFGEKLANPPKKKR